MTDPDDVRKILKAVGISGVIITGAFLIGVAVVGYRTVLETEKLKLEIALLKSRVNPATVTAVVA